MVASRISLNESFASEVFQVADFPEEMPLPTKPISWPWDPAAQMGGWAIVPVYLVDIGGDPVSFAVQDNAGGPTQFSIGLAKMEAIYKELSELGSSDVIDWNKQQLCDGLGRVPTLEEEFVPALRAAMA